MKTFDEKILDYANLIVKVGLNLQPGQNLIINAPISTHDFVKNIAQKAYDNGVKEIYYRWNSEELDFLRYKNANEEVFNNYPQWLADGYTEIAKDNTAVLSIYASNPELFSSIDTNRIKNDTKAKALAMKQYKDFVINGGCNWCVISIPTKGWANSIFKNDDTNDNIKKLWELIFKINRVNDTDPIKSWESHFNNLEKYKNYLNEKKFKKLYYKSTKTNVSVELPKEHIWFAAQEKTKSGIVFSANIPTEEVFTLPHKYGVNGTISSTFPLQYAGNTIDDFILEFKDGKIVDFSAKKGYEILKDLINMDEGSKYLGEVAIVPVNSPIYQSKTIFCNTLYDENASCHFAIGSAYPNTIKNGETFSNDEKEKYGVNDSITHVDFMIGDESLSITGESENGEEITFFKNGMWNIV